MISVCDFEKDKRKLMGRSGKNFKHRDADQAIRKNLPSMLVNMLAFVKVSCLQFAKWKCTFLK